MNRVLVVDDDKDLRDVLKINLERLGLLIVTCASAVDALEKLKQEEFSLVITDLKMGGMDGIELCHRISGNYPYLPVLILTAFGTLDVAVEAIRAGAYDFIVKPLHFESFATIVEKAIKNYRAKERVRKLEEPHHEKRPGTRGKILGEGRLINELRTLIAQISPLDTSILITGESGTGKELAARVIHETSTRKDAPFIVVNCATIPESNFELELFGSIRQSPSSDDGIHGGLIESALNGTILFDEIVHLPLALQPKLLRLFEERSYRPVGSQEELVTEARFIFATNEDIASAVQEGDFREDLFFRINVMHLKLPPLRERGNDILILAHHFLKSFAERFKKNVKNLSDPVTERLVSYHWPGNVRELRNTIERAVAVTHYDHLVVEDLPEEIRQFKVSEIFKNGSGDQLLPVDVVEEKHILGVLKELKGNKALAAKVLGMDRKTLYRKLERYGYKDRV